MISLLLSIFCILLQCVFLQWGDVSCIHCEYARKCQDKYKLIKTKCPSQSFHKSLSVLFHTCIIMISIYLSLCVHKFHCMFYCTYYISCKLYNGLDVLYPRIAQLPVNLKSTQNIHFSLFSAVSQWETPDMNVCIDQLLLRSCSVWFLTIT